MILADRVYQACRKLFELRNNKHLESQVWGLYANICQSEIFEAYFSGLNEQAETASIGNTSASASLDDKRSVFITETPLEYDMALDIWRYPSSITPYKLISMRTNGGSVVNMVRPDKFYQLQVSPLTAGTTVAPNVYKISNNGLMAYKIAPSQTPGIGYVSTYYRKPMDVVWKYKTDDGGNTYVDDSINFELHPAETALLVQKILGYVGIALSLPDIVNWSDNEEIKTKQENV